MKRLFALIMVLVMAFSLVACGGTAEAPATQAPAAEAPATEAPVAEVAADPVVLRICLSETQNDIKAEVVNKCVANIEKATEGRVKFEVYYSDALGSIGEVIEQMSMGGNIVGSTSGEQWAAYGCADMTALNLMYVFPSADAIQSFNQSELWEQMKQQSADNGITMFCMNWACAPRVVHSVKPINSVEDLENLLIRVPSAPYGAFFEALGCATTSMPFGDIYAGMQTGVVEACEAPLSTLYNYSIQEVAPYIFMSEHSFASGCWGTSTAIWNLISEADQKIIVDEFTRGGEEFTKVSAETNGDFIKKMEEAGVTIVYPSDLDKTAMSNASAKSFESFPELSDGLLEKIQATFG